MEELRNILEGNKDLTDSLLYYLNYFDDKKNLPGVESKV